jgi:peroxiredoxin (alkyl hydroperoxide reductase subunit C)
MRHPWNRSCHRCCTHACAGAYTSVCSSKHVPEFASKLQGLQDAGVQVVACTSINDPYVMDAWARSLNVEPSAILMLSDVDGSLHRALGVYV